MNLPLARALRVNSSSSVAFIGSGGKTTAMFQLARELTPPVVVTASSHLGVWQLGFADQHIVSSTPESIEKLEHGLKGVTLITDEIDGDRTKPVNESLMNWLYQFCRNHSVPLLIEADGSRGKPLKAWADHEPPIPAFVEFVVQALGLEGLSRPLNETTVHRPELFSKISGLNIGEPISSDVLVRVLTHSEGGAKKIPAGARKIILLNQADSPELQSAAQRMTQGLAAAYDAVVVSSLNQKKIYAVYEPVAGIILAAGEAKRFGQPKQLLDWKGEPFVRVVAKTALDAGLSPVIVITGANAEQVEAALKDLNVTCMRNEDWKSGQGSSIRTGVKALTHSTFAQTGSAIFLLTDQPQVTTSILWALVEKHSEGLYAIVAPMVIDQRANPVLFDRVAFSDLMTLEGDVGGRAIFHKHRVEYLPWHDNRLLLDVDTPDMYQRLLSDDTL